MKRVTAYVLGFYLALISGILAAAESNNKTDSTSSGQEENPEPVIKSALSLEPTQGDWTFSGIVANENDEKYQYYLEIQRQNDRVYAVAVLVNGTTKEVVLYEESEGVVDPKDNNSFHVGRIFLRFNPITDSWIFGVKKKDNIGFNFKVDMLALSESSTLKQQNLKSGLELLASQTGRLNGHLQTGDKSKEQFVTAAKAWFRQLWLSKSATLNYPVVGILCQFNDGSGFYSVNANDANAVKNGTAGWRNDQGQSLSMSQFVNVKNEPEGSWLIHINNPKVSLSLHDLLFTMNNTHNLVLGLTEGSMPGFCAITHNKLFSNKDVSSMF